MELMMQLVYVHVPTISQLHLRSLTEDGGSLRIPQLLRSLNMFDATLVGNKHILVQFCTYSNPGITTCWQLLSRMLLLDSGTRIRQGQGYYIGIMVVVVSTQNTKELYMHQMYYQPTAGSSLTSNWSCKFMNNFCSCKLPARNLLVYHLAATSGTSLRLMRASKSWLHLFSMEPVKPMDMRTRPAEMPAVACSSLLNSLLVVDPEHDMRVSW